MNEHKLGWECDEYGEYGAWACVFGLSCRGHIDKDDAIACILHLGKVSSGGSTNYFDGLKAGKNVPSIMNGKLACKLN